MAEKTKDTTDGILNSFRLRDPKPRSWPRSEVIFWNIPTSIGHPVVRRGGRARGAPSRTCEAMSDEVLFVVIKFGPGPYVHSNFLYLSHSPGVHMPLCRSGDATKEECNATGTMA